MGFFQHKKSQKKKVSTQRSGRRHAFLIGPRRVALAFRFSTKISGGKALGSELRGKRGRKGGPACQGVLA